VSIQVPRAILRSWDRTLLQPI